MRSPRHCSRFLVLTLGLGASGCAHVQPGGGFDDVAGLVATRIAPQLSWHQGAAAPEVSATIDELLSKPLTVNSAVQVALLNSQRLQSKYEALGISQADLVQAGLLENPVLVGSSIRADGSGSRALLDLGIAQNFLSVFMRPAKKALAETQFEQAKLQVGHAVLELVHEVETAYYEAVGARQLVAMHTLVTEAAQASAEMAQRLGQAGNLSALEEAKERGLFEDARIGWARAETELIATREHLTGLMGLWGPRTAFELPTQLPELPAGTPQLTGLEALAVQHRFDLAAAGREVEILAAALGLTRKWRFIAVAELGIDAERELDGEWLYGPELAIEIPLFDRRQAQVARLEAELRRSDQNLAALAVEIRSDVRLQRDRLRRIHQLASHYREAVIPLRERIVSLTQEEYNFMLTGVFELLMAKREEYAAYQEYIETVRDYWRTWSALERAVGYSPALPTTEALAPLLELPSSHHNQEESGS